MAELISCGWDKDSVAHKAGSICYWALSRSLPSLTVICFSGKLLNLPGFRGKLNRDVALGVRIPRNMIESIFFLFFSFSFSYFFLRNLRQVIILVSFNSIPFPISSY